MIVGERGATHTHTGLVVTVTHASMTKLGVFTSWNSEI